jgi:nucleotide-binding universal stress UspA family protein
VDFDREAQRINYSIERIVYATDFLESSRLALDYAIGFAHQYDATLVMVYVVELSPAAQEVEAETGSPCLSRKAAHDRLDAFAAGTRRLGIKVELDLRDGAVSEMVIKSAEANRADLLVLGTHGTRRGLDHMLVGSNTERILLSARCPTLTVGRHVMGGIDLDLNLSEILFVSDFTKQAAAAGPYALSLAEKFNVPLEICQIVPENAERDPELRREIAEQYCEAMMHLIPGKRPNWCTPSFQLERSQSAEQILEKAKSDPASLIVLGVAPQSHLGRHLHTSFAYELLARATCPLVTIHSH